MRRSAAVVATALLVSGCGPVVPAPKKSRLAVVVPYDVGPLLRPPRKYFGVTYENAGKPTPYAAKFSRAVGKRPNMIAYYADFLDQVQTDRIRRIWSAGALPMIGWEPHTTPLTEIADGGHDRHLRRWARGLRDLRIPVALSFAHEMNGFWYPWGTKKATAKQFVAAYRHIHDIFQEESATSVIWVWSPNVLTRKGMVLQPYWVGPSYADWIGPIGYYEWSHKAQSFQELYGPTMKRIRAFTDLPFLLPETAVPESKRKPAHIRDLYRTVALRRDIVGVVWFNLRKEEDWRIESSPASLKALRASVAVPAYGFDPRRL